MAKKTTPITDSTVDDFDSSSTFQNPCSKSTTCLVRIKPTLTNEMMTNKLANAAIVNRKGSQETYNGKISRSMISRPTMKKNFEKAKPKAMPVTVETVPRISISKKINLFNCFFVIPKCIKTPNSFDLACKKAL